MENVLLSILETIKEIDKKTNQICERLAILETEVKNYVKPIDSIAEIQIALLHNTSDIEDLNTEIVKLREERNKRVTLEQSLLMTFVSAGLTLLASMFLLQIQKPESIKGISQVKLVSEGDLSNLLERH